MGYEEVKSIFDFISPNYPEDLCFYTNEDQPYLISIAHEKNLYFEVEESFLEKLRIDLKNEGILNLNTL